MIALGIDVGYGHTKALSSMGGQVTFPSVVGVAEAEGFRLGVGSTDRPALHGGRLALNGTVYLYGEHALYHARTVVQPRDRTWLHSRPYRVLWEAVIESLVLPGSRPAIVTGLPVSFYHDRQSLEHVVHDILQQRDIQSTAITVVPQPFGSFFDQLLSAEGKVTDERRALGHLGLIDIGYFTTDLAEVKALEFLQKGSGSLEVGVATVLDTVRRYAVEQWGRQLDLSECEQALREQTITVKGQAQDIHVMCESAVNETAAAIAAYAHQLWGGGAALDAVLLTGGGGAVFQEALQAEFSQLRLTSTPFVANARGFMRYALYKERAGV